MSTEAHRRIRIGIDTGGTFTDVVAFDEDAGTITTTKTPSTPDNPADGFINGVEKVLALLGANGHDVTAVSHGTTVATNQLLEGKVEQVGFITTEGYEFILEIARQAVPDGYGNSYFWVKPERIATADLVKTVGGRFDFEGNEVRPFDEEGARQVARWFKERGINTLAVNFLHAYANPAHEQQMRQVLVEEHPEAVVSISSEVLREYREYERSMTTLVDAAVKPKVSAYVTNISERLRDFTGGAGETASAASVVSPEHETSERSELHAVGGHTGGAAPQAVGGHTGGAAPQAVGGEPGGAKPPRAMPFYIMKSNGGVLSADEVVHQPITTVLSGPAAGALGAALISSLAGFDRVLTCDGGGTSTDVSVVLAGEPTLTTEGSVGAYPSKIPMIDVVTVGAGGGSIAWISPEGSLKVGPHSAGADPGPLCYGNGGADGAPTITDAHLLLGRIPPHLLGGEIPLDVPAARAGIEQIAGKLGLDVEHAATGILEISAWNQANALRQISVKRGLDVRDFTLATFGGSGSLLACRLIDILGLAGVIVPPNPGNVSAFGLLTVDVKNDYVQTMVTKHVQLDLAQLGAAYGELTERATAALDLEGFARDQHRFQRTADLRYVGQAFEVRVPVTSGELDAAAAEEVADAFHDAHRALYGYDFRGDPAQGVEWVNLRVTGIGPITRPTLPTIATGDGDPVAARSGTRQVCFDAEEGYVEAAIYWRPDLRQGDEFTGPAIVEEFGSTVPLHPGFTLRVDAWGNLIITRTQDGQQSGQSEEN